MSDCAQTFAELIALERVSEDGFVSIRKPESAGNIGNMGWGGVTYGLGNSAAYQTVKPGFHAYSILGNFLGPAIVDCKVHVEVVRIRDTRTFATRRVEAFQNREAGLRQCCVFIIDFHSEEPASLLTYSVTPYVAWPRVDSCPDFQEREGQLIKEGKITPKSATLRKIIFDVATRLFDVRAPPESVAAQNMYTVMHKAITTQDHLPLTEKTSAEWSKCRHPLKTEGEHIAALAAWMDCTLAYLALAHDHQPLAAAGAFSTLDFAIRIMTNQVDYNQWHLREARTLHGGEGRTYAEARTWDEHGKLVATMSQQCILRPAKGLKGSL